MSRNSEVNPVIGGALTDALGAHTVQLGVAGLTFSPRGGLIKYDANSGEVIIKLSCVPGHDSQTMTLHASSIVAVGVR